MRSKDMKGIGSKNVEALKEPRHPQNKVYRTAYIEGLRKQKE